MKVAIINSHIRDILGGSEIQCDNIATGLTGNGHEVYYLAVDGSLKKEYNANYKVIPVNRNSDLIAETTLELNPDVVYWRYNKHCFYRSVKKIKEKDIKIIFAISHINDTKKWLFRGGRNTREVIGGLRSMIKRRFNHFGFKYVDGITALNPDFLNKIDVKKQIYVPNSMSAESVPFTWDTPFIFWVANIKSRKRPELFVELAKEISSVDFIMVGAIKQDKYEWIREKNQDLNNFYFLGPKTIEEVNGILKNSLFLVHTCRPEGFGNNFIQAWLQAKPAVSLEFDPGGYISENNIGYICNGEFEELVQKTKHLIKDDKDRIEKGEKAYQFVKDNFSIDKTVNLVEQFMEEIIRER